MKQTIILTFFLIAALSLASCRKDKIQPTIKQYDNQQILNYIAAHGLTMVRDTIGGDTTGMYYQVLNPGTQSINGTPVKPLDYSHRVAFVYTERTLDGTYISSDTINNHYYDYVGHIYANHMPLGLQTAVVNLLKYPDASIRVIVPSHLAYGINGTGSGSSQVANNRIGGNESLDIYVHAINNFQAYDDKVINNYMTANNLSGYDSVTMVVPPPVSGQQDSLIYWPGKYSNPVVPYTATYYYKILTSATTGDPITDNSTITATYTGQIFNGTLFDYGFNGTNIYTGNPTDLAGFALRNAFENKNINVVAGTEISILIPSPLGYGLPAQSAVPPFSCLRYTWQILTVTP